MAKTEQRVEFWGVTDEFWARVEPLIPVRERSSTREYTRRPGAGRKPKPARVVFEAVMFVLRTGCQWKALPRERFGSASAVYARFLEWEKVGVFEALWRAGLAEYDQMEGIAWRWQSIDGAMFKAPMAQEATLAGSGLAKAIDYSLKRWSALTRYLDDGRYSDSPGADRRTFASRGPCIPTR